MRGASCGRIVLAALLGSCASGCDDAPKAQSAPPPSAAVRDVAAPPEEVAREGCARAGALEGIENDAACVVARPSDDVMRELDKRVKLELLAEPSSVMSGSGATLRLTLTNIASVETTILFDATARAPGPRPDWSRLAGVPEAKVQPSEAPRLHFLTTTLDAEGRNVDGIPTVTSQPGAQPQPRVLGVRLRPSGKLTQAISWWALRIPPPPPIVTDDAGHRFVPKTVALPLPAGDYTVAVELPLRGLSAQERTLTTRVHVEPGPPKKP